MEYVRVSFTELQAEQKEILIARLSDAGFEGFEEHESGLDAFISKSEFDKAVVTEIAFKYQLPFQIQEIKETNWNELWESGFQPVIVEDYVAVRAGFHTPVKNVKHEIIITPKMSFGTGHHATTYMMIRMMRNINFTGKQVLDFGTGTGILAILAEKEKAEAVVAIDNDVWSIDNAKENFSKNNCQKIKLLKADNPLYQQKADIILANINRNVILDNFDVLISQWNKNGVMLLSGFLISDLDEIMSAVTKRGLSLQNKLTRDNWLCLQLAN
jgi:ribosomal protein L11 methyltransferase